MYQLSYQQQKRYLDLIIASLLILAFLPFWIIVPILIFIDSGWPVIFSHRRVGRYGKQFNLYKFRSMVQNADEILHKKDKELLKKFKQQDWKFEAKDDPRITKLGRILRSLTIDEFPQVFNVIKGEMSIVGPRAYIQKELQEQIQKYPETKKYLNSILSVKPGITGIWQISGRNAVPFPQRAKMDAQYATSKSILFDLKIITQTPKAMFSKW